MAQFAYPTSDVTNAWASGGFADLDEGATFNDGDFAYSADKPSSDILELHLGDVTDPAVSTGHIHRYRWATVDGGVLSGSGTAVTLAVALYQATTLIAALTGQTTNSATFAEQADTLSAGEADAITDYTDLRTRFTASGGAGPTDDRRGAAVSWVEFECPDASTERAAHITAFELEAENAPREAHVTAFELEAEDAPREAHVTAFELEAENAPRAAHVTAFELEAEDAPASDRAAHITAFELETGDHPFEISLSANIGASGENTTVQLVAPAGKTTGDFGGGRIQDDENPGDTIDLANDEYREDEWCIQATDAAVDAAVYQFRILLNGTALTTYQVDPRWTIGSLAPREAHVTAFELEAENAAREAHVTAMELEAASAPRAAHVTAFEMETDPAPRDARVTAFELEVGTAPRDARITAFELEAGGAPRAVHVTAFEMETADAFDFGDPQRRWALSITTMVIGV